VMESTERSQSYLVTGPYTSSREGTNHHVLAIRIPKGELHRCRARFRLWSALFILQYFAMVFPRSALTVAPVAVQCCLIAEPSFRGEQTTLSNQQRKPSLKLGTSDEFGTVFLLLANKDI